MNGETVLAEASAMKDWLVALRRELHRVPEPGWEEYETAALIERELKAMGVPYERRGTSVVALVQGRGGSGHRPTVALRADIDGLPVVEPAGKPFASAKPGFMHACGHDAHAAIALGAARYFAARRDELNGNVKIFFQPAEETDGGAERMIAEGCMADPEVDFVLGLHVMPYLPVGRVETKKGALNGSSTTLKGTVRGKGGHGAYPESAIDAVLVGSQAIVALNTLVSRYVSPLDSAVLTVGRAQGGTRSNIVAEEFSFAATLRTTSDALRDLLVDRARAVVANLCAAYGAEGSLEVNYGYAALVNHDRAVDIVARAADAILGPGSLDWKEKPSMGVEDFSFFIKDTPGAFYHLGCGDAERGRKGPLHSPDFELDEGCLPLGVAMQAAAALIYMEENHG
mgnify:CR=1 FL=1